LRAFRVVGLTALRVSTIILWRAIHRAARTDKLLSHTFC
jgi:hypothetical protein